MPQDFFTNESFFSVAGATAIVTIVSNTIQVVFGFNPKWFALLLSEVVAFAGTWLTQHHLVSDYFISLLNGCLIFSAAAGGTAIASSGVETGRPKSVGGSRPDRRRFFSSWF